MADAPGNHLIPAVGSNSAAVTSPSDRFAILDRVFLFSPPINDVLIDLQHALANPLKNGRARAIAVYGEPHVGKSAVMRRFRDTHPPEPTDHVDRQPVILTTPTKFLDPAGIAEAIVRDANWKLRFALSGGKVPEKVVEAVLSASENRILIINRANFLSRDGKSIDRGTQPFIVNLLDRGTTTIIFVGDSQLPQILDSMPCLADGGYTQLPITPFERPPELVEGDNLRTASLWYRCIAQLHTELPFTATCLLDPGMAYRLHVATDGRLPLLMTLIKVAAIKSLYSRGTAAQALTKTHLTEAFIKLRPDASNPFEGESARPEHASRKKLAIGPSSAESELDSLRIANRRPS